MQWPAYKYDMDVEMRSFICDPYRNCIHVAYRRQRRLALQCLVPKFCSISVHSDFARIVVMS